RRDGYGGEFAGGVVAFRSFSPLSQARALRYVHLYASARFGDTTQATDLVDTLRNASTNPLTASLMSSPLQITFMATVVSARGDPGQDRWQLFSKYYETIYDRELQKAIPPFQEILSGHKDVIDRLHHEIGFWLQFQGEAAGANSVSLPVEKLRELTAEFLGPEAKGFEGRELDELVDSVTCAARHRLVFLTSRVEGELAFEVRGLQEYMAAECVMTGPTQDVVNRLRAIAPSPYWRNVFLFAAGKCFFDAQSRHYQDPLLVLCGDLNDSADVVLERVHAGSELGLAVLESGAPAKNPTYTRHLSKLALELLTQPDVLGYEEGGVGFVKRLAAVYRESASGVYRDALQIRVGQVDLAHALGAWPLLVRLADRPIAWAQQLADRHWPGNVHDRLRIVWADPKWADSRWLQNRVYDLLPLIPPFESRALIQKERREYPSRSKDDKATGLPPSWFNGAEAVLSSARQTQVKFLPGSLREDDISIYYTSLFGDETRGLKAFADLRTMPSGHPAWVPYCESHRLLDAPNANSLAATLRSCIERGYDFARDRARELPYSELPWPLAVCLATARSQSDLANLALRAEQGQLGDTSEWRSAENRWSQRGIGISELSSFPSHGNPFDASIATVGFPITATSNWSVKGRNYELAEVRVLLDEFETGNFAELSGKFLWVLLIVAGQCRDLQGCDFNRLAAIVRRLGQEGSISLLLHSAPTTSMSTEEIEFYDICGLAPTFWISEVSSNSGSWGKKLERAFMLEPERLGLLRLLSRCVSNGYVLDRVPLGFLSEAIYSDRRIGLAALLIGLSNANLRMTEAQEFASWAARLLEPPAEPDAADLLFRTIETHLARVPALESLLIALRETLPSSVELGVARCEGLLRSILRRRLSGLQHPGRLAEFKLPDLETGHLRSYQDSR